MHGEFLFIQLHSRRCEMVWWALGRSVTSALAVAVAAGCLSGVYACVFICIVFFWQRRRRRRRTALLCLNSPLSTHIPMRRTHAHTHTGLQRECCCCCCCYSVVVVAVAVGAAVVFISFRRNGRCQNEFERASERMCWTENNRKKLKRSQARNIQRRRRRRTS